MIRIAAHRGVKLAMIFIAITLAAFLAGDAVSETQTPTSRQQINLSFAPVVKRAAPATPRRSPISNWWIAIPTPRARIPAR
jgi:hypothetical protein